MHQLHVHADADALIMNFMRISRPNGLNHTQHYTHSHSPEDVALETCVITPSCCHKLLDEDIAPKTLQVDIYRYIYIYTYSFPHLHLIHSSPSWYQCHVTLPLHHLTQRLKVVLEEQDKQMGLLTWLAVPLLSVLLPSLLLYTSSPYVHSVDFVGFQPLPKLEFEGVLAQNQKLTTIRRLGEGITSLSFYFPSFSLSSSSSHSPVLLLIFLLLSSPFLCSYFVL